MKERERERENPRNTGYSATLRICCSTSVGKSAAGGHHLSSKARHHPSGYYNTGSALRKMAWEPCFQLLVEFLATCGVFSYRRGPQTHITFAIRAATSVGSSASTAIDSLPPNKLELSELRTMILLRSEYSALHADGICQGLKEVLEGNGAC